MLKCYQIYVLVPVNLTLITFARINGTLDGQVMAIFKTRRSASVDEANLLKY